MVDSRNKGKTFERLVANMLKSKFDLADARRGLTQSGGALEPDVTSESWPFWTECKAHSQVNVQAALRQAERDVGRRGLENPPPVLVIARETGGDIFFAFRWAQRREWGSILGHEFADEVTLADGNVLSLTRHKSWRTFRKALGAATKGHLVLVEDDAVIGWIEELEQLWRARE